MTRPTLRLLHAPSLPAAPGPGPRPAEAFDEELAELLAETDRHAAVCAVDEVYREGIRAIRRWGRRRGR